MDKKGFHRWVWLVVFLLGGLLMLWGGAQDAALFFAPGMIIVQSWHTIPPVVGLACGLVVLVSAVLNILWGWRLKEAQGEVERRLALRVTVGSGVGMIADWVSGYYGFGSLIALLVGLWVMRSRQKRS